MSVYHFRILTPSAKKLDDKVLSIVAPGEAGYLGILANHAPLITTLGPGHLKVTSADSRQKWFRIEGGILKVAHNEAVVLTESIEEIAEPKD